MNLREQDSSPSDRGRELDNTRAALTQPFHTPVQTALIRLTHTSNVSLMIVVQTPHILYTPTPVSNPYEVRPRNSSVPRGRTAHLPPATSSKYGKRSSRSLRLSTGPFTTRSRQEHIDAVVILCHISIGRHILSLAIPYFQGYQIVTTPHPIAFRKTSL